jgi:hypothetical protein
MSDDKLINNSHILISLLREANITEQQLKDKYPNMYLASLIEKVSLELEVQRSFINRQTENVNQYYKEREEMSQNLIKIKKETQQKIKENKDDLLVNEDKNAPQILVSIFQLSVVIFFYTMLWTLFVQFGGNDYIKKFFN